MLLYYSTNSVDEQVCFRKMNFCCQKYFLYFSHAQPVLPQGHAAIFVAGASVFGVFAAGCNFSHLKGEELTVIHLLRTAGLFLLLSSVKKYAKLKMPPRRVALRCCLQAQVVMLPSGKRPGDVKAYCLFPRSQTRKGGCIMVLNDVLQLFVIVGGTVGITFQIAWAIFKEIHNNKK